MIESAREDGALCMRALRLADDEFIFVALSLDVILFI